MKLEQIIIKNFRGYKTETRIQISDLTAIIGKNDAGKSTILEALGVFLEEGSCALKSDDVCRTGGHKPGEEIEVVIGCVFSGFPEPIVLDADAETSLAQEYLLNEENNLEIHLVTPYQIDDDGSIPEISKAKIKRYILAHHPTHEDCVDLLQQKNSDLKTIVKKLGIEKQASQASNPSMREAIRTKIGKENLSLKSGRVLVDGSGETGMKQVYKKLSEYLPHYALFRSDRPSTDADSEVQDPMKIAIKRALDDEDIQKTLAEVEAKVQKEAESIAKETVSKIQEIDQNLAADLDPKFGADPKWESLFKLSFTGEHGIPINKRGSGARRLILLGFFQAEADRKRSEETAKIEHKRSMIYAIEEPETSQHPDNQRKIITALNTLAEAEDTQILLTTHTPEIAGHVTEKSMRLIDTDGNVSGGTEDTEKDSIFERVIKTLGNPFTSGAKVLVCVEGPIDVEYLHKFNQILLGKKMCKVNLSKDALVFPLGGSTLTHWAKSEYLKKLHIPEFYLFDSDKKSEDDQSTRYSAEIKRINERVDRSVAKKTLKREIENYLHDDAIKKACIPDKNKNTPDGFRVMEFNDIGSEVFPYSGDCKKARKTKKTDNKKWLCANALPCMDFEMLQESGAVEEIRSWFEAIEQLIEKNSKS